MGSIGLLLHKGDGVERPLGVMVLSVEIDAVNCRKAFDIKSLRPASLRGRSGQQLPDR